MTITRVAAFVVLISITPTLVSANERATLLSRLQSFGNAILRPPLPVRGGGPNVMIPKYPPLPRPRPDSALGSDPDRAPPANGADASVKLAPVAPLD